MSHSTISKENSKSEIEDHHLKSPSQEDPKVGGINFQFFGTLNSLSNLAFMNQTCSRSDVVRKCNDSLSNLKNSALTHQKRAHKDESYATAINKVEESKPVVSFTGRDGLMKKTDVCLANANAVFSSSPKLHDKEKNKSEIKSSVSRASLIQNIKYSIDLLKAKTALTSEEREQLKVLEDELFTNLREYDELKSHIQKLSELSENGPTSCFSLMKQVSDLSIEAENVRRVIVCESTCNSVPKVVMCDNDCEVMSFSGDMDSEDSNSSLKSSVSKPENVGSNSHAEHNVEMQFEMNQESINVGNSDCSFCTTLSCISVNSPRQRALALAGGADEVSQSAESLSSKTCPVVGQTLQQNNRNGTHFKNSMNSCCSTNFESPSERSRSQGRPEKSSYHQPSENFHSCYHALMASLFSNKRHLPYDLDFVECSSFADSSSSSLADSCGHVPSEPSSVFPQWKLSGQTESFSQSEEPKSFNSLENTCGAGAEKNNVHEDSRTILKTLSKDYKNTKKALQLKILGEENKNLTRELRRKDVQILQLKKKIDCFQFEVDLKPKTNNSSSPCSSFQHKKPLQDMENGVNRIQKELNAVKREGLEVEAAQLIVKDSNQVTDNNLEDVESSETDSFRKVSEQFNARSSRFPSIDCPCPKLPGPLSVCDTHVSSTDLRTRLHKTNKQNEWLLKNMKETESELNEKICRQDAIISMLKDELRKQNPCGKQGNLQTSQLSQLRFLSCSRCNNNRQQNDNPSESSEVTNEFEQLLKQRNAEVRELAQNIHSKSLQLTELEEKLEQSETKVSSLENALSSCKKKLENDLQSKSLQLTELEEKLKQSEAKVSSLENELSSSKSKMSELEKNQLSCCEEKLKNDQQSKLLQLTELEEKLKQSEAKVSSLENELSSSESKRSELSNQLSCCEKKVFVLAQELANNEKLMADSENYANKIKESQEKLVSNESKLGARESALREKEKDLGFCQSQSAELYEQLKNYKATICDLRQKLELCENKSSESEKPSETDGARVSGLEEELKNNEETISELSNKLLNSETKTKDLQEHLKNSQDKIVILQKELEGMSNKCKELENQKNVSANQVAEFQQLLHCAKAQLCGLMCERDVLLEAKEEAINEVKGLKKNTKRLENTNYCLAKEIAAEVERLKVDLMIKLHNFSPVITSLEVTQTELHEALALFKDAEERCYCLNHKLHQTNEELQALKAMKQSASKSSKLLNHCSEKSLQNQLLLSEACEDLGMLNSEKTQLKSAVESLMNENEEKSRQLSQALQEMEELKKEICHLKTLSEERK